MIDNFALALTHALLGIALWRVLLRDDLDRDPEDAQARRTPFARTFRRRSRVAPTAPEAPPAHDV